MFRTILSILILAVIAFAADEDCSSAIDQFKDCREAFRNKQQASRPDPKAFQDEIKKCYTGAGCKEPSFEGKGDKDDRNDDNDAAKQCRKNVGKDAQEIIRACVQKKTGVNLKPRDDSKQNEHGEWHGHQFGHHGGNQSNHELQSLCSSDDQRDKVQSCMKSNRAKHMAEAQKRCNDNEANRRECFSKLSATCQKKFNDTKAAVCACAQSDLKQNEDKLNNEMKACPKPSPKPRSFSPRPHGSSPRPHGGDHEEHESLVDRITDKVCNEKQKERDCSKIGEWQGKGKGGKSGGKKGSH